MENLYLCVGWGGSWRRVLINYNKRLVEKVSLAVIFIIHELPSVSVSPLKVVPGALIVGSLADEAQCVSVKTAQEE